jgi:hypothetical protein
MPAWPGFSALSYAIGSRQIFLASLARPILINLPNLPNRLINLPNLPSPKKMPAGYSSRCKSCNSPHRLKIEAWHKDGKSPEAIEVLLRSKFDEMVSYKAIRNHLNEHYNVPAEAREQYQKSQANIQKDAEERLSEIEILDSIVSGKHKLHQKLEKIISNQLKGPDEIEEFRELPKIPAAYVTLYTGCAAEIRQAMKTKQELLGEDSGSKKAGAMQSWVDLMLEDEAK